MKHILSIVAVVFATSCFGQEACPNVHDINANGTIDIEDFLSILGLFADVDVDEDGVWDSQDDCLDATACNYLASPTEPCGYLDALGECGGACEGDGDGDGICDDVDTCVGELDECGVCNGPGPTEVVIEDIVITYDSVFLPLDNDWYVFPISADTTFTYSCGSDIACEGTLALLTGCDNPTIWKFSSEFGALSIGPEPGSSDWYASPANGLYDYQYDDRWILTSAGEFIYLNNGETMNPFDGYVPTSMTVEPSTYTLDLEVGIWGTDRILVGDLTTESSAMCGWMGVWDSGPMYDIIELTENRLVLLAQQQQSDCVNPEGSGYFTLIFVAE